MWVETGFFSESRHLSLSVQESSYGSPLTTPKRPKRKLPPKRRQERPVAAPKKRRRKVHRVDQYSAEARRKKVSLRVFQNFMMEVLLFRHFSSFTFFNSRIHSMFEVGTLDKTSINVLMDTKENSQSRPNLLGAMFFLFQTVCFRESHLKTSLKSSHQLETTPDKSLGRHYQCCQPLWASTNSAIRGSLHNFPTPESLVIIWDSV